MTSIIGILTKNAGALSVLGALTLFFSWVVTNTFASRYSRTKQSVETAEATFRLYSTLHGLRDQINSLAMEVVQTKHSTDASRFRGGITGEPELDRISTEFDLTRLAANQIKELEAFTAQTNDYSLAVASHSEAADEVQAIVKEVHSLSSPLSGLERDVEVLAFDREEHLEDYRKAVAVYVAYIRDKAIPAVGLLYSRVVSASNRRGEEGRIELRAAKARAELSSKIALFLYVLGSLMVLGGQYLDKIHTKQANSQATTRSSQGVS